MDIRDVGAELRSAREERGLTIDALAKLTRVQPRYLTAIEGNEISIIPPKPFGRGFVRAYATEVGLDPEKIVRDYFGRFAPPPPPDDAVPASRPAAVSVDVEFEERRSRWAFPAVVAAALALLGVLTFGRGDEPTPVVNAVGTAGTPDARTPPPTPVSSGGTAEDAGAAPARRLTVVLDVSRTCWVTATTDGQRAIYTLLQPGAREKLTAGREIVIRAGDAGALTWSINGGDPQPFGASGEVRTVKVTGEGVAVFR
jgi:cytoskeletal protein RodZ